MYIFNDSWLMLMNWCSMINRPVDDQSRWNRDRFEHSRDLQWPSTLRAPAPSSHTIIIFVSSSSRPVFLSARLVTFWFLEVSDMSFGRSSWNINLGANHAYLTHIGLNGKFHGRYRKNNRKRARVGRRGAHTNTALISRELKPDVLCVPFL